jgi:transcriptional regulator with XRE-family HTH domain
MKKQKSLRQLARELGVSASYLSQVKSRVRPASQRLLNMLSNVKQDNDNSCYNPNVLPSCVVVAQGTLDP